MQKALIISLLLAVRFGIAQNPEAKYNIGYQSRKLQIAGRVVPLHLWYPTQETASAKMPFGMYVEAEKNGFWGNKSAIEILSELIEPYTDSTKHRGVVSQLIEQAIPSQKNTQPAKGFFPLVIINSGLTSSGYVQSTLAEFLASHGFVVVSFPNLPLTQNQVLGFDQPSIQTQLHDTETIIEYAQRLPFVSKTKLYMIAWSVGGVVQILYQMKHHKAQKIISLDAASQYEYGWKLIQQSPFFNKKSFDTPFLQFSSTAPRKYNVPLSSVFYDSVAVRKKQILCPITTHAQMLSIVHSISENTHTEYPKILQKILTFLQPNF